MGSYVNWEEKECYFDSDRFISLVNRVRELPIPTSSDLASFELDAVSPRQDCFDRQLAKTEAYGGYLQIDLTQEERDFIREVVDNAYYCTGEMSGGEFVKIIGEELWPVWAGDKTPEEAVKVIQSRATLLVNE